MLQDDSEEAHWQLIARLDTYAQGGCLLDDHFEELARSRRLFPNLSLPIDLSMACSVRILQGWDFQ